MAEVLVINPNSNQTVTRSIDAALEPLRRSGRSIMTVNLTGTPEGIQSQADVDAVALPVAEHIERHNASHDSFVIACFSDPGLYVSRERSSRPVFGIAQTGLLTALSLGQHMGVISILSSSIPRHWRYYRSLGIASTIAGDIAINTPVAELADEGRVLARMLEAGRRLIKENAADVLVLGCAGMARYRGALEEELQVAVVDPTQAAVTLALGAVSLGLAAS